MTERAGKVRIKGTVIETQLMGFFGVLDKKRGDISVLLDPKSFKGWKGKKVRVIINEG